MSAIFQVDESADIIARICPVILATVPAKAASDNSALRTAVGDLSVNGASYIASRQLTAKVANCMYLARLGGATQATMAMIRSAALEETPQTLLGTATTFLFVRLCLANEAVLVASSTFASRDDAEEIAATMNDAFTQAAEAASDDLDAASYMSIVNLQATVTRFLADKARLLPQVINVDYRHNMTALRMAQLAYADASRYAEIIAENKIVHPAFCPQAVRILSS